jgi:F-type H+-transporting ATPase subunit b
MLIDWFTVCAQALNFLILVWLMKRFLYKPILDAIDVREKSIEAELSDAATRKAEAQRDRDEFQHKNDEFDQQRAALLSKATDTAKDEVRRLLADARKTADALSAKQQEALRSEQQSLSAEIARRTRDEVFAVARKALADLAGASLEERATHVFVRKLRASSEKDRNDLKSALKSAAGLAVVRSAFELPATQQKDIEDALKDVLQFESAVRFDTAPDLVSGIDLSANGWRISWSIADYLASLEISVDEVLKAQPKPSATLL